MEQFTSNVALSPTSRPATPPLFSTRQWFAGAGAPAWLAPLSAVVDRVLGLPALSNLYRDLKDDARPFWDRALDALDVSYDVQGALPQIPTEGPLVVVANHPYGGLDGLILGSLLGRLRPDLRVLTNGLLGGIPEVRRASFLVDPSGQPSATSGNARALRSALRWVEAGGALAAFPAGEVAHRRGPDGAMIDSPWAPSIATLAARAGATVVPVFFSGGNSRSFVAAGRLDPRLRTLLLVRELLKQRHRTISLRVGPPIPIERLRSFETAAAMTAFLRLRLDALALPGGKPVRVPRQRRQGAAPIAGAEPADLVRREFEALAASARLLESGDYRVYVANAAALPHGLREIGRLREIAFRAAGEGSGKARDLDEFDQRYLHLVVWNTRQNEIVGAYRLGRTDRLSPDLGVNSLYTRTLFQYDERLLDQLGPGLELGRAFVRPEYQRDYSPLLLLWKGIGAYVVRHPRYRRLFGTVSISADYRPLSQQLMAAFLRSASASAPLAGCVVPLNPPSFIGERRRLPWSTATRNLAAVNALVAEIEDDGKGLPVLLRQYLKLNARLLGFNVDQAFAGVLDGLMMVDLLELPAELRRRYMGREGSDAFAAYHAESR